MVGVPGLCCAKILSILLDRLMDAVILCIFLDVSSRTDLVSNDSLTASGPTSANSLSSSSYPVR